MFSKKDLYLFLYAALLVVAAYICMIMDPVKYGFGILTLWVAPPLLFVGLVLPFFGIIGTHIEYKKNLFNSIKKDKAKHLSGFIVLAIAICTYSITLEPTASLWDCSEFIACAYKLQVPHSPGAPLFLLMGRLFSMLAWNDVTKVALVLNLLSALFSALTVYIVFHLIYFFGHRLTKTTTKYRNMILISSASCGSLCLSFSDTFWFSAVEAEAYAAASFFLLLLAWLIITGMDLAADSRWRRVILIFYLAGLSYCVHPMCLLALPLLPLCWYSQKKITLFNLLLTVGLGLIIVMAINRLIAVSFFEIMFSFDLFFVNTLHFPFYSGVVFFIIVIILLFIFLRRYKKYLPYTWASLFLITGFTPYFMLFIRSNFNPPIDETNPENLPLIRAYMNRDSYGAVPLLYGPYFDAEIIGVNPKRKMYYKTGSEYKVAGSISEYEYDEKRKTILPRMYSTDKNNIMVYRNWTDLKHHEKPNFIDNLKFMLNFQLGEMYLRYLLFNFSGRESDAQYSSWLKPWDSSDDSTFNKARNQYWMIPLILGLTGAVSQYSRHKKDFYTVCTFFLVTGVVLVVYLNSPPNEPRERDYIYVGSFIAYSLWIGLGALAIGNFGLKHKVILYVFILLSLAVPSWMAYQNFDDHDRRGRTFQMDNARNLLQSCASNSILFTGGDNDTFPLWYLQEVEGFRTDVRVMVLSYLSTDWYINQLRRSYYKSQSFELCLSEKDYLQYGPNDVIYLNESIKNGIDAREYLQLLHVGHPALCMYSSNGEPYSIIPSKTLKISVADIDILHESRLTNYHPSNTTHEIKLSLVGNYLPKSALAIIDILVSNNWQRPIYFNFTSQNQIELDLNKYLVQEGLVYRLTPFENLSKNIRIDTDLMYENLIVNANYKNILRSDIYFNYEDFQARMIEPVRSTINSFVIALLDNGDKDKASVVLNYAIKNLYPAHIKPSLSNLQLAEILFTVDKKAEANRLALGVFDTSYIDVKGNLANDKKTGNLSIFLLQKSAELLDRMSGSLYYKAKIDALNLLED